jgi:peroxin-13
MYGSRYGGSSLYGGGMGGYGSSLYGGGMSGYGGGMYGSGMGGYGGGMYGGGMGGYGSGGMYSGGMMGPGGGFLPGDPTAGPPIGPPSAWQAFLGTINGAMMFFGRLSFLVDENAHAIHFFISALLQLLDRAGSLYGELARFVFRILFNRKGKSKGLVEGGPMVDLQRQQPGERSSLDAAWAGNR